MHLDIWKMSSSAALTFELQNPLSSWPEYELFEDLYSPDQSVPVA